MTLWGLVAPNKQAQQDDIMAGDKDDLRARPHYKTSHDSFSQEIQRGSQVGNGL